MTRLFRLLAPLVVLACGALILTACAAEEESGGGGNGGGGSAKADKKSDGGGDDCGTTATEDCTPHVGEGGKVRVDALIWSVQDVEVTDTLGDMEYGLGEKADGKFVVVTLKVRSDKDESATLTDNAVQLEVNGNTYDTDTDGTIAAIGDGQDPLFFEDIGPDASLTGRVVYDVPAKVLKKPIEMRLNELGLGETHGYIALPALG